MKHFAVKSTWRGSTLASTPTNACKAENKTSMFSLPPFLDGWVVLYLYITISKLRQEAEASWNQCLMQQELHEGLIQSHELPGLPQICGLRVPQVSFYRKLTLEEKSVKIAGRTGTLLATAENTQDKQPYSMTPTPPEGSYHLLVSLSQELWRRKASMWTTQECFR